MGEPQPLYQNDADDFLLFQLFKRKSTKALHRSYKLEPPNEGVKTPPI
jgi:hypothetical protein